MKDARKLAQLKDELEDSWRIADELGDPTFEHVKTFELVSLEMKFRAKSEIAMNVASLASNWVKTHNPSYIDQAIVTCFLAAVEPCPSLQHLIAEVAHRRLEGKLLPGTSQRLVVGDAKRKTLLYIANLIHAGETKEIACSKGAAKHARDFPNLKPLKASTLDRYYSDEWRTPGPDGLTQEDCTFPRWDEYKDEAIREEWKRIARDAPTAPDDLRGERR